MVPPVADDATHVYHQYTIRVEAGERDRIVTELREQYQVGCGVYYPIPNHELVSLQQYAPAVGPAGDRAARPPRSSPCRCIPR